MVTPVAYYQSAITQHKAALQRLQKRITLVALSRLLSFLAVLTFGWFWIGNKNQPALFATLLSLLAFIWLVRLAFSLRDQKALTTQILFINENEAAMLQHQPNRFSNGQQYAAHTGYVADLDIFGDGSLFQLLNRTTTSHGSDALASLLQQPPLEKKTIEEKQQAIAQLATQTELRQQITAHGLLHGEKEGNLHQIQSWLQMPPVLKDFAWVRWMRIALPVWNMAAVGYYLITDKYNIIVPGVLLSWMIIGGLATRIKRQHELLSKQQSILDQYGSILQLFSSIDAGSSTLLQQEQVVAKQAHQSIRQLARLASAFDQRLNLLVNLFLNSFFLYDVQCLWRLEEWKARHQQDFSNWINSVGAIETLNSLASFSFNHPQYQQAAVSTNELHVEALQLGHPLIPANESVYNDCSIGKAEKLILLTGSNMSGKTTFLRTLGVNLVLAQCGAPVCAARFVFTPVRILSSIRVSDSLQEHTSYFMAELKRLQQIIRFMQSSNEPALVLIDEILRGTNSEDKTHGSEQFIKKLLQYHCITIFATHDLTLSRLENELPGQVNNYCFESTILQGELLFDYKLQRGVAKNKNASFLMQKMEII